MLTQYQKSKLLEILPQLDSWSANPADPVSVEKMSHGGINVYTFLHYGVRVGHITVTNPSLGEYYLTGDWYQPETFDHVLKEGETHGLVCTI